MLLLHIPATVCTVLTSLVSTYAAVHRPQYWSPILHVSFAARSLDEAALRINIATPPLTYVSITFCSFCYDQLESAVSPMCNLQNTVSCSYGNCNCVSGYTSASQCNNPSNPSPSGTCEGTTLPNRFPDCITRLLVFHT